jgi:hypothetical protein
VDYLLGRTDEQNNNITTGNNQGNNNDSSVKIHDSNIDGVSREMLDRFQTLKFEDKIEVMSLVAELSKRGA